MRITVISDLGCFGEATVIFEAKIHVSQAELKEYMNILRKFDLFGSTVSLSMIE